MKNFREFMEESESSEEDDGKKDSPELISLRKNKEKSKASKENARARLIAMRKRRQETAAKSTRIDKPREKGDNK